ncbi:putative potassium channel protein YugO [Thalassobacillus devorans]|uniref:Potassium channel protein YugO n=1 Tax=Thalassobacillus devorans TaxID=279813 RepID=A0ABQ1NP92_9BACI|nr:potassium channel family protein [Thalassobacillus devorans]NIK29088.1 voltage-gated potassium channel [Thalassobacillus devorans]GGC81238.1 putative potassium channel protein YugO [Thalassobacillus devorans]
MYGFVQFYFRLPIFVRLLLTVIMFMIFFGSIIHLLEPSHFPTLFDGVWWAFVTGSTVGYGDYVPLSTIGRIVAILLILAGGGLLTFYMATISAGTIKYERDLSSGKVAFKGENHIIVVGWNERTRQLIDIMQKQKDPEKVVVIDKTMKTLPYRKYPVHFIRGDFYEDKTLLMANITKARKALITADPSQSEDKADQAVILGIVAMKGCNPDLNITAEILTEKQVINAERAGAKDVIRSNDFMSSLFYHELYRNDPVQPFELLLKILTEEQFYELTPPTHLIDVPFSTGAAYYAEKTSILIGLLRKNSLLINVDPQESIREDDRLVLLSSK